MVVKSEKIPAISVNYRRKAGTKMQKNIYMLCEKYDCTPNQLIDLLVIERYIKEFTR